MNEVVAGGVSLVVVLILGFFYLFFDILIGLAARSRGRSGFLWFLFSCFTTPIIAGLFLLVFGTKNKG